MARRATDSTRRDRRPRPSPVGRLLQHWRRVRRMSQLDLAVAAQVTPRHVSFVESGRARPSRDMVLILARAPDLTAAPLPVIPVQFRKDGLAVSYFSMVTTVGTPQDVTAEEIRLESFFPADQATEARRWT